MASIADVQMEVTGVPEEIRQIIVSPVIVDILHLYKVFHAGEIPKGLAVELVLLAIAKDYQLPAQVTKRILDMFFIPICPVGKGNVQKESAPRQE